MQFCWDLLSHGIVFIIKLFQSAQQELSLNNKKADMINVFQILVFIYPDSCTSSSHISRTNIYFDLLRCDWSHLLICWLTGLIMRSHVLGEICLAKMGTSLHVLAMCLRVLTEFFICRKEPRVSKADTRDSVRTAVIHWSKHQLYALQKIYFLMICLI